MKDMEVKKRGWVKNAAIIFLIVMLVLTFFSNTIMNRSLPEVAAQYTTSGSITARIRVTGTVTANESFDVKVGQTRTVSEVPVRLGDKVNVGDVLIRLTGAESEELEDAKTALRTAEVTLETEILNSALSDGAVGDAVRAVQSARNTLSDAQRVLSTIQYSEAALNSARAALNQANATLSQANAALTQPQNELIAAQNTEREKQLEFSLAMLDVDPNNPPPPDGTGDPVAWQNLRDAERALTLAKAVVINAQAAFDIAKSAVDSASAVVSERQAEVSKQEGYRNEWFQANSAVRDAQINLDAANANLALVHQSENVGDSLDSLKLRELRRDVEDAKDKVDELEKESSGTEIASMVGGIVTDVNVSVNTETVPDEPLMVIEVVDRGYSLSYTVTTEQASRVSVGDQAEVDRGWWSPDDDIRATLIGIRNNPQNPATSRILHFSISGNVESGDQLNLILNQRAESYSIIVPNSAIRTDTNGDFVLVVMSRSSPLGNRYIATRVDVNVLATDDTHSAVAGGLSGWDFVITTATAPIDPGMQVRLVDNP